MKMRCECSCHDYPLALCHQCCFGITGNWISVKDETPPEGWLLIAYKYYADPSILCSDFGLHFDGRFESAGVTRDVTHWMRVPEPPNELD